MTPGLGWTLREVYTDCGVTTHLTHSAGVEILTLESFIAKANRAQL